MREKRSGWEPSDIQASSMSGYLTKTLIMITQKQIRDLFEYRNGNLYWKMSRGNHIKTGDRDGWDQKDGYRRIKINDKSYSSHRVIFLYHHGYLPEFLDHIDGNRSNNNISNLRGATKQENGMNQKNTKSYKDKPTSSRFKGVGWHKQHEKWQARIMINAKSKHIGYFDLEIEAALSYNRCAIKNFGEFAKINNIGVIK